MKPKFKSGDRVKIISGGHHHNDLVGSVQTISRLHVSALSMPDDPFDYMLVGYPRGAVAEHRMEIVTDETVKPN